MQGFNVDGHWLAQTLLMLKRFADAPNWELLISTVLKAFVVCLLLVYGATPSADEQPQAGG